MTEHQPGTGYQVTIKYNPNGGWGMRWSAEIRDTRGTYRAWEFCCRSRRSAERKADRHIRRLADTRTYTYTPKAGQS